jgi:hypothetical protein
MEDVTSFGALTQAEHEKALRQKAAEEAQGALPALLSGRATFAALKQAIDELTRVAPPDHDVLIQAFDLIVSEVVYIEPHAFIFRGQNQQGHNAFVICHFTQLIAKAIYRPKRGDSRIVTGFSTQQV